MFHLKNALKILNFNYFLILFINVSFMRKDYLKQFRRLLHFSSIVSNYFIHVLGNVEDKMSTFLSE